MKTVYLIVGVPGSGKSTICQNLADKFTYVPHDDYNERIYPSILLTNTTSEKPVLGEIPFGLSKIQESLEEQDVKVIPVFLFESEATLLDRWKARGLSNPSTIKGHLTRQRTYRERAEQLGAFAGSSDQVLLYLQGVAQ